MQATMIEICERCEHYTGVREGRVCCTLRFWERQVIRSFEMIRAMASGREMVESRVPSLSPRVYGVGDLPKLCVYKVEHVVSKKP